jgi:uncharacterized membrane protein YccC
MGDRVTTEHGEEVEYATTRDNERVVRVVPRSDHLKWLVGTVLACVGTFGGFYVWSVRSVAREEIVLHNLDRTSHPYLRETVTSHIAQDSLQQQEAREMRDQISRIESRQIQMADTLSQLKGSLEAERGRR